MEGEEEGEGVGKEILLWFGFSELILLQLCTVFEFSGELVRLVEGW